MTSWRRGACALIVSALALSGAGASTALAVPGSDAPPAVVAAAPGEQSGLIETTIPHTQKQKPQGEDQLDGNFFTFSDKGGWAFGQDGTEEHVWSGVPGADRPASDIWYEVEFVGTQIDIYSGKNHPMGIVKYTIDKGTKNEQSVECDLYNPTNQTCEFIHSFKGLSNGKHTLHAEATGKKNDRASNSGIDCAKVVVHHAPYAPTKLESKLGEEGLKLKEAGKAEVKLTTEPDYVSDADLTYASKNEKIATVDENGMVTAVGAGTTEITVTPKAAEGAKAAKAITIPVTVAAAPILDGFISDVDTQWTQDRYAEALGEIEENDAEGAKAKKAKAASEVDDSAALSAWKNDAAISEITLASAGKNVEDVTLEATDFTAEGGKTIEAKNVELSFTGSTKAYNGKFLGYGNQPNKYPQATEQNRSESNDILLGSTPVDVEQGKLQNIFVKVNVPKDAEPGDYVGTVKVTCEGSDDPLEFKYTLKVQDATLPDASSFGKTFDAELWQYPYSSAEYYGVEPFSAEHFEILKPIMELYKEIGGHAITTTIVEEAWSGQTYADPDADGGHDEKIHYPSMIRWEMDENGMMTYDFSHFDAWVEFNQELGIGDKIVLYSIAPWHNSVKYYDAQGNLQTVPASTVGQPEGNKYWRHFLNALVDHLEEKGWFDIAYMAIDERGITHEAFDMVESVKNSKGESLKTAGAMDRIKGDDRVALAMRIDDLNIGDFAAQDANEGYDELLKKRAEAGLRTTLYSCTEHYPGNFSLSNPVESYWSIVNAEKDGNTSGFLRWAYDAWVDDPLNDATHWAFEAGDCFLIYPGADKATVEAAKAEGRELTDAEKTAKSSIRLERMAEGLRDANKIKKMRAEVTDMTDDIQKVYDKITRVAAKKTNRDWTKVDQEMAILDAEMSQFKEDLVVLTDQYIEEREGAPTKLTIVGADTVATGETLKLSVESDTASRAVDWDASNTSVATVGADGVVTAKKPGVCEITATSTVDEKVSATKTIVVTKGQPQIPEVDVTDAQVAHYTFEKDAKDDWTGASARAAEGAQDGTINGEVAFEKGKDGKGVHVNAAENKTVSLPDDQFALDGAKAWTVGYWVKSVEPLDGQTLPLIDEQSNYAFAMRLGDAAGRADAGFRVGPNDGDVLTFKGANFKQNEWYRVAWTNDPAKGLTMYVNGVKTGDTNTWTAGAANKANVKIPVDVIGGNGFNGIIDELAIYDRVLTQDEITAQMHEFTGEEEQTGGLGLESKEVTLREGQTYGISGNLTKDVTFKVKEQKNIADDAKNVKDHDVVSVSRDGVISGDLRGTAVVTVTCGKQSEDIKVTVKRNVNASNQLGPVLIQGEAEDKFMSDVFHPDQLDGKMDGKWDNKKQYYGQPDMIRVSKGKHAGRLITAFPQGHGHGPLVMMISDDEGKTWTQKEDIPESWDGSLETPTMYALNLEDGTERLMLITACPNWGSSVSTKRGWQTSYSDDGGDTWTEYNVDNGGEPYWPTMDGKPNGPENPAVVGMASLVQLYENGKPAQKWMGIFHHQGHFKNYKTILTFEEKDGKTVEKWSKPEPLFTEEQQVVEDTLDMCEIGMFRSPDNKRIVGLVRSQSHAHLSTMIYSDDEGKTWSDPIELPGSLSGERHKALYDPISGRLVITFREMNFDVDHDGNVAENGNDWICEDWGMWVGTYEQLMNQEDGQYRFRLDEDWVQNRYKGDTGYTGMTVNPETGLFVMDSYGHWDKKYSESWKGTVTTDLSYIRQARFTLNDLLSHYGFESDLTPLEVQVTFDHNYEGDTDAVQTAQVGKPIAQPEAPVREGYRFDGWFTEPECTNAYNFETAISDSMTLYAKWTKVEDWKPLEMFVTFKYNDGVTEDRLVKVGEDGTVAKPADPAREGYVFDGWFTDAECTEAFDFATKLDGNISLYAKWTKAEDWKPIGPSEPVDPEKPVDPENPGGGNKPVDPSKPGNGGNAGKPNGGLPQTGDATLIAAGGMALAGAVALGGAAVQRRKRSE